MDLDFSFKYKDYEIRACPKHLVRFRPDEKNVTIDVRKIQRAEREGEKDNCFSLAYFIRKSEGYELRFVGARPFKYIAPEDLKILWSALKHAQEILDEFFEMEEEE